MTMRKSHFVRSYGKNHVYSQHCERCGALIGNYGSYASYPYCTSCEERIKEAKKRSEMFVQLEANKQGQ